MPSRIESRTGIVRQIRRLLLVAFHFPPLSGGSGVHRATNWARHLPENGWQPHILTVNSRAYLSVDFKNPAAIPENTPVKRAFALDAKRHLSLRGRYSQWSALPDQWANWALTAVPVGLATLQREQIDLIMVTFPIATAVLIGLALQRLTGKTLVVDFRDSMTEEGYPANPRVRAMYQWIEKSVIKHGTQFIFTADSARQMYLKRYQTLRPSDCVVIPNGYDEDDFVAITTNSNRRPFPLQGRIRLVHAGLIYQEERDPTVFFRAVRKLKLEGTISAGSLEIDLRASGSEHHYAALLREFDIADVIQLLPALPHCQALQDMANADGLLLFQAASCNHQIPAKAYEYLRLEKPILALTSMSGDTATLLRETGGTTIANLADESSIVRGLSRFLESVRNGTHPLPDRQKVGRFTRRKQTAELARHLDVLCSGPIPQ
jgi:glycosyltransferase involved in cell wall biosynthesis